MAHGSNETEEAVVLVTGDSEWMGILVGTWPLDVVSERAQQLERAVLDARWDAPANDAPAEPPVVEVGPASDVWEEMPATGLVFAVRARGEGPSVSFSVSATPRADARASVEGVCAGDPRFEGLRTSFDEVESRVALEVHGMPGCELIGRTRASELQYSLLLARGDVLVHGRGRADPDTRDAWLSEIRTLARTIRPPAVRVELVRAPESP